EGASVVAGGGSRPGAGAPAGVARLVGIGLAQLREDARANIPKLVTSALGLTPATPEPPQTRGTLRIPGERPQASDRPQASGVRPQEKPSEPPPAQRSPP